MQVVKRNRSAVEFYNQTNKLTKLNSYRFDYISERSFSDIFEKCCETELEPLAEFLIAKEMIVFADRPTYTVASLIRTKWVPPPPGRIKLNTDGGFNRWKHNGEGGGVFRNHMGHVLGMFSVRFPSLDSVEHSEFRALLVGLTLALKVGFTALVIELDSLPVVQAIQGSWDFGPEIWGYLR